MDAPDEPRYWLHAPGRAPIGVSLKTQARQLGREGQRRGHSTIVLDRRRRSVMLFGVLDSGAFTEVEGRGLGTGPQRAHPGDLAAPA